MNSTIVNRAIRSIAWPVLKDYGFGSFTSRTAWRDREHAIDIVNFQSFNRYHADALRCTTFSFAVNLSIYLPDVGSDHAPAVRNERLRPTEYEGHIRRRVYPTHPELPRSREIWLIDEHGDNTESTVTQAAVALRETAVPWFAALGSLRSVLSVLRDLAAPPDEETWLPGAPDSASRNTTVGYVALALGDRSIAGNHLRRALEQHQGFDAQNAKISRRFERGTPRHLENVVALLSDESA